jgi:hypothetical protein
MLRKIIFMSLIALLLFLPVQDQVRAELMKDIPKYSERTIEMLAGPDVTPTPGEKIITLDNNRQAISLEVNERFLLKLGEGYDWNITIDDQNIVSRLVGVTVIKGAQGIYEAHKPGSTTLTAVGDPVCRKEHPPCMAPTIEFQIQVVVKGAPTATAATQAPGFEVLTAIAILLMLLVRRRFN